MRDWITMIFFYIIRTRYMYIWITMNFFDSIITHICMIESLWKFFDSLRTHMCMIESLWFFFDSIRTHICMIESLWIFFTTLCKLPKFSKSIPHIFISQMSIPYWAISSLTPWFIPFRDQFTLFQPIKLPIYP